MSDVKSEQRAEGSESRGDTATSPVVGSEYVRANPTSPGTEPEELVGDQRNGAARRLYLPNNEMRDRPVAGASQPEGQTNED